MTRSDTKVDRIRHPRRVADFRGTTVSLRSVQPVLAFVRAGGFDVESLLKEQGVGSAVLGDPEGRLAHAAAIRVWQAASAITRDANLGLHVAESLRPGMFGALDYSLRTCENLGAALAGLCRYHRLLHDAAQVKLEIHRDDAVLSHWLPLPGGAPRQVSEFVVAGWLTTSRQGTGVDFAPLQVCFPHGAPADVSEHQRIFRCRLTFGHARSELVLPRSLLEQPLVKADPLLQRIVEEQVHALLAKLPNADGTTEAVRRFLAQELSNGHPKLEQLAPRLRMSSRTLHRKLEQEGTTFRKILAEVRRELAMRYLSENRLAIGEIAFLLGFSEVSAFHRAFRHWTGEAPHAFRMKLSSIHPAD